MQTQRRGVVTDLVLTIEYPDGSTKETRIGNNDNNLVSLIFDEKYLKKMVDAGLSSPEMLEEWTSPTDWRERQTLLLTSKEPVTVGERCGKECLICMCSNCADIENC